ncbi:carboxypeptidase PM20D1 [Sinobacterium caligoides]|uniref:Carboxypeptidase PM20D1 n=1 Tax=Sinobacterium caligoides TaxID=933926 RepID=A0A3N2E080_9GAMM|nr:M20/M25/M40 family metallo-hydrolase [Sinobacterium caligoides]ROS05511.1 carboxypeptidase PM20D1 [Sinobacterium caligoides]
MTTELTLAEQLSAVLALDTTTRQSNEQSHQTFNALFEFLEQCYPRVFGLSDIITVNEYSKVLTLKGKDSSEDPDLFVFHSDVVPVEQSSIAQWTYPPFSGEIARGYVWGRGALDNKGPLIAFFSALENLLRDNLELEKPLTIAIGHDEETGGHRGAAYISMYFKEKSLNFRCLYDEGMPILRELAEQAPQSIGLISTAEKGFLNARIRVIGTQGHAAMPPMQNCIERLCELVGKIKIHFNGEVAQSDIEKLKIYHDVKAMVAQNMTADASTSLVDSLFRHHPFFCAQAATTLTVTVLDGGVRQNVLPNSAEAVFHFRIVDGQSVDGILKELESFCSGEKEHVEVMSCSEPSRVSDTNCSAYTDMEEAMSEVFPEARVTSGTMIASSDAAHYLDVAENLYRFIPFNLSLGEVGLIHGVDERVSTEGLTSATEFYRRLLLKRNFSRKGRNICR